MTTMDLRSEEDEMKSVFVRRDRSFRIVLAICAVAVAILGFAQRTEAQGPVASAPPFSSGMVGLASGQTARLNVVNLGAPSPLPCVLVLAFLDNDNKILKQMFVSVGSGKAAFVDLGNSGA